MKNILIIFGLTITALSATAARPMGPSSGGGGFVVDCAATFIEPRSVTLLDLYEAREKLPNAVPVESMGDLKEDYFYSAQRTYGRQGFPEYAYEKRDFLEQNLKNFFRSVKMVNSLSLPKANDLGKTGWVPPACKIRQVAFFADDEEMIYIDQSLFEQMDAKNQAALVQHELWYRYGRALGDKTSELTRLAVAHIFTQYGIETLNEGMPKDAKTYGGGESGTVSAFAAFPLQSHQSYMRLQFAHLAGRGMLTKTWIDVPQKNWIVKFGRSQSNANIFGCIVQEENQNIDVVVPVKGTMTEGFLKARYMYKTGEPISLEILQADGTSLGRQIVTSGCK